MEDVWNPWHGCIKYSEGCQNCYVYRRDESVGRDPTRVEKTAAFDLPLRRDRHGAYKIPGGSHLYACMTSDFFLDLADVWRAQAWEMMRIRSDVSFTVITKRIVRAYGCLPPDWGAGYPNVSLCCTVENQHQCQVRMPVFSAFPAAHKQIICEPLLGEIDLSPYLTGNIEQVSVGGESGEHARVCDYRAVLLLQQQCRDAGVSFSFHQTGALLRKDGRVYAIPRALQHEQAKRAGIDLP